MNAVDAAVLGTIQALTEFLPVSSSGHLRLGSAFLGLEEGHDLLFDIVLHLGTLLAVVGVYRKRIGFLLADVFRHLGDLRYGVLGWLERSEGTRYAMLVVLATLPTGVIGVLMKSVISGDSIGVRAVGGLLLVNAVLLAVSKRFPGAEAPSDPKGIDAQRPYSVGGIGPREALLIGIMQGLAVLPGISRSGATIVTALALGAWRMKAAEFSFLLSIPAILGATLVEFDLDAIAAASGGVQVYLLGAVVSAAVGVLALLGLLRLLRSAQFHHFAWYCALVGLAALLFG
jgi:undecaprenyl-diphosphatase